MLRSIRSFDDAVGAYGPDWTAGVLAEHLRIFGDDVTVHVTGSGRTYVCPSSGGKAYPVLCGEIIPIRTEDEIIDGRCGGFVYENGFACPGHSEGYTDETCEHGLSAWLCEGPNHYPSDF